MKILESVVIAMTVKELSRLYHLNREIELDKQRLAELEAAATSVTATFSGMPHSGDISNKTSLAASIVDMKDAIMAKNKLCIAEYNRLMRYITSVEDSLMRQILAFRYVNGLSWYQVSEHIGCRNTEASIKMAHKRFLEKSNSCPFCYDDLC